MLEPFEVVPDFLFAAIQLGFMAPFWKLRNKERLEHAFDRIARQVHRTGRVPAFEEKLCFFESLPCDTSELRYFCRLHHVAPDKMNFRELVLLMRIIALQRT